jgi:hypothetical protein
MSRLWYVVALLPLVAGIALAVFFFFDLKSDIETMQRVAVPGEEELYLPRGEYVVYAEGPFSGECAVIDSSTGDAISLEMPSGTTTYNMFGHSGRSAFEMDIPREGGYRITCRGGSGQIAIGHGLGAKIAGIALSLVGGFILMGAAMAIVATLRYKRRKPPQQPPPWAVAR